MKNYFIANGEILNTDMSIEEIETRVQDSLNENTSGMVQFRIKEISEKEVRFFFIRDFRCDPNKFIVYDADMALITGIEIGSFQKWKSEVILFFFHWILPGRTSLQI